MEQPTPAAKHPPEPKDMVAKHPPSSTTNAAKHPHGATNNGGKASAKQTLATRRGGRNKVKAGVAEGTSRRDDRHEDPVRPETAELPGSTP
jgi:hypothetical protein